MKFKISGVLCIVAIATFATACAAQNQPVPIDLSDYQKSSGATVTRAKNRLRLNWPTAPDATGAVVFNLNANAPLIESLSIQMRKKAPQVLARQVNPVTNLTVGERDLKPGGWTIFFDNPRNRPHQTFPVVLDKKSVRVQSVGVRTTVRIGTVSAGSFAGDLQFTVYRNSPLLHVETVVQTSENGRAIYYDTGLASTQKQWQNWVWRDPEGALQNAEVDAAKKAEPLAVAGRTLVAQSASGALAVFPAPHQFFYPQDEAFNLQFVWHGRDYNRLPGTGFGIRQSEEGDKRFVPWFNAPPGTDQRLGVFYLLSAGNGAQALAEVARYTNGDRFVHLPGYKTYSSHYHIEHTLEYLRRQREENIKTVPQVLAVPGFVKTFKARGIDIVHLAEFHVGNTPDMKDDERLPLLKTLHEECARLSDAQLLVLPGEEPNVHLGGHWLSLFPRPVYWVLNRDNTQPFVENVEGYGKVYHVGNSDDVLRLMRDENGLMWTAHPRIKASRGFPDNYRARDFFLSDQFLGGAWKAMPADLSQPRLGARVLDLMDDMANWGVKKYTPGEADLFRMETGFETYAHLNINYLKLDKVPRFQDGWQPVLDALSNGKFFTSTGEVLIPDFSVGGKSSGETLETSKKPLQVLAATLRWNFPMNFAEIVSGDGQKTYRQRLDLNDTQQFGTRQIKIPLNLQKRTWIRLEAWDIAGNGAFTQPIWLDNGTPRLQIVAEKLVAFSTEPATWARYVPERRDDFAWENDLVAFRTYGPAILPGLENSGIDCWNKRVPYPIIDKWYRGEQNGVSYHEDHGEGLDLYNVGDSRGCGGTAIWSNGRMILSGPYKTWKTVAQDKDKSIFELSYDYDVEGERVQEIKRITIELGKRLFRSESTWTKNGQPANLEIAIGITTHEGKARANFDAKNGWMACWEKIAGNGMGTGVVCEPQRVQEMREFGAAGSDQKHALLLMRTDAAGKTVHYAGYGWEKAGAITTPAAWQNYLAQFARQLN